MSFKKTLLLGLLLIIIGSYFYLYEFKGTKEKQIKEEQARKVFLFSKENIEKINLKRAKEKIILKKKGSEWELESPVQYKADLKEINTIIETLLNAEKERTIEENPSDLSLFGLKDPKIEILIKLKDNSTLKGILFGNNNPTNEFIYVKTTDNPEVFLTDISIEKIIDKGSYNLRDKSLIDIDINEINKIDFISKNSKKFTVEKESVDNWNIKKPLETKGDKNKIENLLVKFKNAAVKEFIDEPKTLSSYGLDKPNSKIVFWLGDKEKTQSLLIGNEDNVKKQFFAKREDMPTVFLIEKDLIKNLPKVANDLRDRTILVFNKEDVLKVEFKQDKEKSIVLKKENDIWNIIQPIETKADELEINNILWTLENSMIKDFIDDQPKTLSPFGLDEPLRELKLWQKGGKKPEVLLFGSNTPKKEIYSKLKNKDSVFMLESNIVDKIFKSLFHLRDRRLIVFKDEELEEISINLETKNISLKKKKGKWELKISDRKRKKINEINVKEILWGLNDIKFLDIQHIKDPSLLKLENFELKITLLQKKGKELDTMFFYKDISQDHFALAKVKSKNIVYSIKRESLDSLKNSIKKLSEP